MTSVFLLASDLGPVGAAKQLALVAPALPRDQVRAAVGVLGPAGGPFALALRRSGVPVEELPVRHLIDFEGLRRLRRAVAAAGPAVVHAWGPAAARVSRLLTARSPDGGNAPRLVVSAATDPGGGLAGWLACRRLRQADRVVPMSWAEAERYRRLGVRAEKLTRIGPAVAPSGPPPDPTGFRRGLGIPATARLVFAAGRLDRTSGLRDAIWAFDVLKYDAPDLYLVLFGEGPERGPLEQFGKALGFDDYRVRFVGFRPDLPAVLALADAVWVAHDRGGVNVALEGMAAGRPVVGWKTADLAEVVADGETGFLVAPGDRVQLAAKTRAALDPATAARLGAAGRERALHRYPVGRAAEQFARVYEELTTGLGERGV